MVCLTSNFFVRADLLFVPQLYKAMMSLARPLLARRCGLLELLVLCFDASRVRIATGH